MHDPHPLSIGLDFAAFGGSILLFSGPVVAALYLFHIWDNHRRRRHG